MSILHRLRNRLQRDVKAMELSARRALGCGEMVCDYGWVRLPYSGDGDVQEVIYHLNCQAWYEKERSLLSPYVRQGDTVIDVGANVGFMAALFCELVGDRGQVYAFEPSPHVFRKLERVISLNGLWSVEAVNAGCGSEAAAGTLYRIGASSGNASLVPPEIALWNSMYEQVDLVRLDDFLLAREETVDFLKIDTEGYESAVLEGAREVLERDHPTLYIELSQEYRSSSRDSVCFLRALGYEFVTEPDLSRAHNGDNFVVTHPLYSRAQVT